MEERFYEIDGRKFVQRPLVWGQIRQLLSVLDGVEFRQGMTTLELIKLLGDKIPDALSVVLTEQGQSIREKDLTALADFLGFSTPVETVVTVIEDFFDCNPTGSYLEKVNEALGKVGMTMKTKETSLTEQSSD